MPRMTSSHTDALILGGGVIGLSCALYLLKAGATVRVLERDGIGSGASHGNCGTLTPSHAGPLMAPGRPMQALRSMWRRDAPLYVSPRPDLRRFAFLARMARYANWQDFGCIAESRAAILKRSRALTEGLVGSEGLDCEFAPCGELYVYRDPRALEAASWHPEWLERTGVAVERWSSEDIARREPALKPGMAGGFFHPGDAHLRPDRYVAELARRVREMGGQIEERTRAKRIRTSRRRLREVRTNRGTFTGERVILALGAWSPQLARPLGLDLPMQPGKGYSLTYTRPDPCPRHSLILAEASVCATAWSDGYRLGSTMEFSGYRRGLDRRRLGILPRAAADYLHQPEGPEQREAWWGWRPMSVDELPIIGPVRRWSNLILATGHGMMGMGMSAATGEMVAALCAGPAPVLDPSPYAPSRFGL